MIPIRYNIRSLAVRRATSIMTALAVGVTVMLLLLLLGFINGVRGTITKAAGAGTWLVIQRGANTETGFIPRAQLNDIRTLAQIETDKDGVTALMSAEMVLGFNPTTSEARRQFSLIRGVNFADAVRVHRGLKLVSGRWPLHSQFEYVVGRNFAARFPNLAPPHGFRVGGRSFKAVGIFSDNGSARESEAWSDLDDVLQAYHLATPGVDAVHVVLKPGSAEAFKKALSSNGTLRVDAMSEEQFYQQQAKFADQLRALGLGIALILGVGSVFGGMNTMYAAVARRSREVGVLRVLGFGRGDILSSFLLESLILGAFGGLIGFAMCITVAYATGLTSHVMTVFTLGFRYQLSAAAIVIAFVAAILIGAIGGLLPAIKATRIQIIESLREA